MSTNTNAYEVAMNKIINKFKGKHHSKLDTYRDETKSKCHIVRFGDKSIKLLQKGVLTSSSEKCITEMASQNNNHKCF